MNGNLSVNNTTAPQPPLPLEVAKAHLRVSGTADDEYIEALIEAAGLEVEGLTGRALINRTYDWFLDEFPLSDSLEFPRPPLVSVTSITYTDADGNTGQTFASSNYHVSAPSEPFGLYGRLRLNEASSWPSTKNVMDAVTIKYVAGYGDDPEQIPYPIRQAMLLIIGHLYENRQDVQVAVPVFEMPQASRYLLNPYMLPRV